MMYDQQGNRLPGANSEAASCYIQAVEAFNLYTGDPVALLDKAVQAAPEFTMAHILKAHLFAVATEPDAMEVARNTVRQLKDKRVSEQEASHLAALELVSAGQWTKAAIALEHHNMRYPLDLVALQSGHLLDFYRASARSLRDRIARVLPKWSENIPGYSILLGMHAFGLEETGDYSKAEDVGRRALASQPLDCWAHHAVTHVMEMQGRPTEGLAWATEREPYWAAENNFFKVHNWWHRALFHLELGQHSEALAIYDEAIRRGESTVALDLVDASALLWRLHLSQVDLGPRWQELAKCWQEHADGRTYTFNDWHAAMAYLGAGHTQAVDRLLATMQETLVEEPGGSEMSEWTQRTALPLVRGFTAFWRGDYWAAVEQLFSARPIANTFGGSHAQRDIIDLTLIEAALRGGVTHVAEALSHERLALKPHSPVNRSFLARSQEVGGTGNHAA
ncbi:tetratricopeptide repeat protein [Marinobacter sp. X15-166B]|uniref:tetratricopeptide repeat protein n=1 Tax=Marinobacter sp. X15-166B TaxID=1897620 RepID=UPI00085C2B84|nr:tetratricopeptide repeat protein [Marinobacter sp. X15-166B]OEY67567.1 hypothetical protein BG841_14760 [Marinobacter sp. X15-166B]